MSASFASATPNTVASAVRPTFTSPSFSDLIVNTLPSKLSTMPVTRNVCCCAPAPPAASNRSTKAEVTRTNIESHRRRHVAADIHRLRQYRSVWLLIPAEDNDLRPSLELVLVARRHRGDNR